MVEGALRTRWADVTVETKVIKTGGDHRKDVQATVDVRGGRKGLFTGESERALVRHDIALAVHCAKDLPRDLLPVSESAAGASSAPVDGALLSAGPYELPARWA